jgi:hypothetical protein
MIKLLVLRIGCFSSMHLMIHSDRTIGIPLQMATSIFSVLNIRSATSKSHFKISSTVCIPSKDRV